MPPRTRRNKRTLKENIEVVQKTNSKLIDKVNKPPRKALADKTNSVSDDNVSIQGPEKVAQKATVAKLSQVAPRSRRERRLPIRYVENNVLKNLSNNKNDIESQELISNAGSKSKHTRVKKSSVTTSPIKRSQRNLESSLIANKLKRISCLSSPIDGHAISHSNEPNIQPCHASTPLLKSKRSETANAKANIKNNKNKIISKEIKGVSKETEQKHLIQNSSDTNNNAKGRLIRNRKEFATTAETPVPVEHVISPIKRTGRAVRKKLDEKSSSFRVLENKKQTSKRDSNTLDVYEFTYDPNDEPPPAKKKRKRIAKKKPAQTRKIVYKNTYDKNVAKALAALKNVVAKKPDVPEIVGMTADRSKALENKQTVQPSIPTKVTVNTQTVQASIPKTTTVDKPALQLNIPTTTVVTQQIKPHGLPTCDSTNDVARNQTVLPTDNKNYNSVRVEDIAADFEISGDEYNDINYSPVNSPHRVKTPEISSVHNKDPLNLQDDIDFFDGHPVASSSMNMSTRHVQASPWRVEFNNLPIKWHVNSYVKPNMTPAVESSFINFDENRKKHVYTNMLAEEDEALPEIESNNPSNLKQTSIISFIREVAERSAKKKKRAISVTPTKENSLFNDLTSASVYSANKTPKKVVNNVTNDKNVHKKTAENVSSSLSDDKENSNVTKDNKKKKTKSTQKEKDGTFFGFDDTEDQENVFPEKINNPKVRALRPRSRAVLQEINAMTGPMRAALPVAAKSKVITSSDIVNKVYEEKTAADAPVFPEENNSEGGETDVANFTCNADVNDDDSMSVHLFEDIELVHHLKPSRKSYGKAKKVTFQQTSSSDTEDLDTQANESGDQDDLSDLTFRMPCEQQKKPKKKSKKPLTKKQKLSKKEEQEMEAWAAGFNSMCEEIEEFPLVLE